MTTPRRRTTTQLRCTSCNALNPSRAKFCLECGRTLQETSPQAPAIATAERRQLTVMFCDLQNSVPMAEGMDPEDLRAVLADYQRACSKVVERYGCEFQRYFGDGILFYFGYPNAHEDEGLRAVRSALGIIGAMHDLNVRLEAERGINLVARLSIHTGLVVAGDIASGEKLEKMAAVGPAPNVAARLQSIARPNTILITDATYQLVTGFIECLPLGPQDLDGVSQPVIGYEVLHETTAQNRIDIAARRGLMPMAGRDAEFATLQKHWAAASSTGGQSVLVIGEPGIGKSRLCRAVEEHVAHEPDAEVIRLFCSPYHQNSALYPVVGLFERAILEFEAHEATDVRAAKLEAFLTHENFALGEAMPLFARLLDVPLDDSRYPPLDTPPEQQRQQLNAALVRIVLARANAHPVLVLVEDVHWADPSTVELLTMLLEQVPGTRILTVFTCRPEFEGPWLELPTMAALTLNRLDTEASRAIVEHTAGRPLTAGEVARVLGKADGVPLYLEELTRLVAELGPLAIPTRLADSLMARLDRLGPAKAVAQLGATIGRQFEYDLLLEVERSLGQHDEAFVQDQLARVVASGLVLADSHPRGTTYSFKHALIRDAAYESLLRSTRQGYHASIAHAMIGQFPARALTEPEVIARHFTQAGLLDDAVTWWFKAGDRAVHHSAHLEAIAHLSEGLDVLARMPEANARDQRELELRMALGPALMATRGYASPEAEVCYLRAGELRRALGESMPVGGIAQLAPILHGLWAINIVRARHATAMAFAQQVLHDGESIGDDSLQVEGHMETGWAHFFQGRPVQARASLEASRALYDHSRHAVNAYVFSENPYVSAGVCLAEVYWVLGYPEQALRCSENTLALLEVVDHPYSAAFAHVIAAFLHQLLRDPSGTRDFADQSIAVAAAAGMELLRAMAQVVRGWALTWEDAMDEGIAQMRSGLAAHLATGAELLRPYFFWMLGDALRRAGQTAEALALVEQADAAIRGSDECYLEAEVHRLRGQLLLPDLGAAEAAYQRALEVAHGQEARSLELRAAVCLALLWHSHGRTEDARDLLLPIYDWFTEGHETPDLIEARTLLEQCDAALETTGASTLRGGR